MPNLHADLNVVVDLSPLGHGFALSGDTLLSDLNAGRGVMFQVGLKAASPLPSQNGQLAGDVAFDVSLSAKPGSEGDVPGTTTVTIAAADTDFNETPDDLLRDINDALGAAGLADWIEASLDDQQRLTLIAISNDVAAIEVDGGQDLGFSGTQSGSDLGLDDVEVALRDGTTFAVDLDGSTTVQDVIDRFGAALQQARTAAGQTYDPNDLVIEIDSEASRLVLTDNTPESTIDFEVRGINGSLAGMSLGLLGVDDDGDGVIEGSALHGDSLAKHVFLESPELSGGIQLVANDFNASANFGFVGVNIEHGSVVDLDGGPSGLLASVHLVDANELPVARVPLSDLFDALSGDTGAGDVTVKTELNGGVRFSLPVSVDSGINGLAADQGTLVITIPDITTTLAGSNQPAVVDLDLSNLGGQLASLTDLTFQDVIDGLRDVITFMQTVESQPELAQQLPLVDFSLKDFIAFSPAFSAVLDTVEAAADVNGNLQSLEEVIEDALGIPDEGGDENDDSPLVELSLDTSIPDRPAIRIDFQFTENVGDDVPIAFDIADVVDFSSFAVGGIGDLVDVSGGALLQFSAGVDAGISLGLEFDDDASIRPFLYDFDSSDGTGTRLNVHAGAFSNDVNFDVSLGPVGFSIVDGKAGVGSDTTGTSDAELNFSLGDGSGRRFLDEPILPHLNVPSPATTAAVAFVELPFFFNSASIGTLAFSQDLLDMGAPPVPTMEPGFSAAFDDFDVSGNLLALAGGWEGMFNLLIDGMRGQVLGVPVPLVGDSLKDEADFLENLRDDVVDTINDLADTATMFVQDALFQALGPQGLDLLQDADDNHVIDLNDVLVSNPDGETVEFNVHLRQELGLVDAPIGVDLALPGLSLDVMSGVQLRTGFDIQLDFGVSLDDGFFVSTDNSGLELFVEAMVPGLTAVGKIGFLDLNVTDIPTAQATTVAANGTSAEVTVKSRKAGPQFAGVAIAFVGGGTKVPTVVFNDVTKTLEFHIAVGATTAADVVAALESNPDWEGSLLPGSDGSGLISLTDSGTTIDDLPSRLVGSFQVGFQEPAGASDPDGRLSLSEMYSSSFSEFVTTTTDLRADIDLHLEVSFAGSSAFPRMRTDFIVDWQIGSDPTVNFENVQMNLGDFFSGFAGDILGEIQRTLAPVQPVVEVLTKALPVLSDLSGHPVTLVDVARQFGRADVANFAQAVIDVNNLIVGLPQVGPDVWIDLGEFSIPGSVALDPDNGGDFQMDVHAPSTMPLAQFGSSSKGGSSSGKWVNNLQGAKGSFSFPFLTDPSQAFELLLGGDADLFRYDAPALGVDFSYSQFFPVPPIPILGAEVAGTHLRRCGLRVWHGYLWLP